MNRFISAIAIAIGMIVASIVAACSATGPQPNLAQVQQVITSFCPTVNTDLTVLSTSPTVAPALQAQFKQMVVINEGICSAGTSITATNLQTLNTQVVQAAITILLTNPTIPNQPAILLALQLGQPLVTQAIAQIQAATPAPAPAAPAVAPAAPVKVS